MPYGQFGNCQSVLGPNCHGSKVSVHHILYSQSSLSSKACGYRLTQTLSQCPITFACSALPSLPIPAYVYHVSSGYANFELFENHWTMSPWDTCPHFCDSLSWLVQHGTRQFTEVCDRQTTTGAERHQTSRQRYAQVQPWTVTEFTRQLALARCSRSGPVQARCYSPPMSPLKTPQYLVDCCVAIIRDYVLHVTACWPYHAIDIAHSAVRHSQSLDPLYLLPANSETSTALSLHSDSHSRHSSSNSISVLQCIRGLQLCAIQIYILLTYIETKHRQCQWVWTLMHQCWCLTDSLAQPLVNFGHAELRMCGSADFQMGSGENYGLRLRLGLRTTSTAHWHCSLPPSCKLHTSPKMSTH